MSEVTHRAAAGRPPSEAALPQPASDPITDEELAEVEAIVRLVLEAHEAQAHRDRGPSEPAPEPRIP